MYKGKKGKKKVKHLFDRDSFLEHSSLSFGIAAGK